MLFFPNFLCRTKYDKIKAQHDNTRVYVMYSN